MMDGMSTPTINPASAPAVSPAAAQLEPAMPAPAHTAARWLLGRPDTVAPPGTIHGPMLARATTGGLPGAIKIF